MFRTCKRFAACSIAVHFFIFLLSAQTIFSQNPIAIENALPGNPSSQWDITGAGDLTIQGFATDLSVDNGTSVSFKINVTDGATFNIKIYRLGYYLGNGARLITDLGNFTGTIQPSPLTDIPTGLVDCGNWSVSASWSVPANATPGLYIAKLTRTGNNGASHIAFVVRDDASTAPILFQTSDATWQAYNVYGGNSLYLGSTSYPSGHAVKVSYNRPFLTRSGGGGSGASEDWLFNAEYPMIRWLERNGYNMNYATNIDAARNPNLLLNHQVFLSVGHDEYWSKEQRNNIEAARNSGKHLAFFSGNEVYWKTRWENSIDGSGTPWRTLVCYKEGTLGENGCGNKCDPSADWTGLWRDGCNPPYAPNDGCLPENALTGQISWLGANAAMQVPYTYKNLRFWRNTSITSLTAGQVATLSANTLGYELDWEQPNGKYPSGRILMSSTNVSGKTHKLSLYKHSSGAWVFGAGTVQWSWGLDGVHDGTASVEDIRMQQATVNLFADMGVQPGTLQAGLIAATASTDNTAPASVINIPVHNTTVFSGVPVTITGTATDANAIGGVEVSVDGGTTWHVANGAGQWSYTFTPSAPGTITVKSRSFDDSGNMEIAGTAPSPNAIQLTVIMPMNPETGPGGPILVISKSSNPFSKYPAEILRAAGLNEFAVMDITAVTAGTLNNYDVVILGEMSLLAGDVTLLTNWVTNGGTLIAMRPDAQLASLLGITATGSTLANKYLLVNTASGPGSGIVNQTIQYHGTADLYNLNGATSLGTLYSDPTTATTHPAITTKSVGPNGGSAVAFLYDLSRSIVYTRQGNPAWAGDERDGTPPVRSNDMFYGNKAGDPQPDWIDLNKVAIPQADEQMHLLSNIIIKHNLHRKPLPRFWFLPKGLKAAVVMTGDDHANNGTTGRFNQYISLSPSNTPAAIADWTAIRGSSYIYPNTPISSAQATAFEGQGFEIGLHLNTGCTNWTPTSFQSNLTAQKADLISAFPGISSPTTNRTHCIAWSDWSSAAELEAANGIRLEVNYYYWPASWVLDRPGMFTGSGMPMRFAKLDGSMIDCYQVATQLTDESGQTLTTHINTLLDNAIGSNGYYGVFCANMHTDATSSSGSDAIIASALARQIPVISARQMLNWLDGRNNSSFGSLSWSGTQLSFTITHNAGLHQLKAMLPVNKAVNSNLSTITRNGNPVPYVVQTIKGIAYAFFDATGGSYVANYPVDVNPPIITNIVATPNANGTATITWTTDENADSRVDYGTSPGSLTLNVSSSNLVTSHSLVIPGLFAGDTYHFRVTSADASANSATAPQPPAAPLNFTMPNGVCAADIIAADFNAGTPDANTIVINEGDGAVSMKPAMNEEFSGAGVPAGWTNAIWNPGGITTFNAGLVTLNGSHLSYNTPMGPGTSIEFRAMFTSGNFQNIGFTGDADFNNPWIVIGRGSAGDNNVYARSNDNPGGVSLGSTLLDAMHTYRIQWLTGTNSFAFYVDGVLVATPAITQTVATNMIVHISNFPAGGAVLTVDWIRASPYPASGIFTSRVFDAGSAKSWGVVNWTADMPATTTMTVSVRRGNTAVPDGTWSAFTPVSNGGSVGCSPARYVQYKAELGTGNNTVSPKLKDITIDCGNYPPDVTPPLISNEIVIPNSNGTAVITWTTDEPSNSVVNYGTVHTLLNLNSNDPALVINHSITLTGLTPGTTYFYQLASTDCSNNTATLALNSFAVPFPVTNCFQDIVTADFVQGTTGSSTYISPKNGGEVILKPTVAEQFPGTAIPPGWQSFSWTGGTTTVSGGSATVDGARLNTVPPTTTFGPGSSMEFVATFGAGSFQHIGFGGGTDAIGTGGIYNGDDPWAMFSTGSSSTILKARTSPVAGTYQDFDIPGSYLGTPHLYRIHWKTNSVEFYIDGTLVHTQTVTIGGTMRPAISDYNNGGAVVSIDWINVSPYSTPGTFISRIFDAGDLKNWDAASWSSETPAGTTLQLSQRQSNSAVNILSEPWTVIPSSGATIGTVSQFIQYKADFTTTDPAVTPVLKDISFTCSPIQWITMSGNVWFDENALFDNMVNNTGTGTIPTGLRIYLVNTTSGLIEKLTLVNPSTGTFSFSDVMPNSTYRLYLSGVVYPVGTPEASIAVFLPNGWEHTGQKNANPPNNPVGSDGINDGKLTVPATNINTINANFGIRLRPTGSAVAG